MVSIHWVLDEFKGFVIAVTVLGIEPRGLSTELYLHSNLQPPLSLLFVSTCLHCVHLTVILPLVFEWDRTDSSGFPSTTCEPAVFSPASAFGPLSDIK